MKWDSNEKLYWKQSKQQVADNSVSQKATFAYDIDINGDISY